MANVPPGGYPPGGGYPGGPPPGGGGYGPPPGGAPPAAPYGAPPAGAPYGAPPAGAPYGAPPAGAPYGAPPPGGSPYGAPPANPYGGPPQPGMPPAPMPPPPSAAASSSQTLKKIVTGVFAGVVGVALTIGGCWAYGHPSIHMLNTTSASGLTIYVDGESVTGKLASSAHETPGADESASVSSGSHTLVAKDASGKVVDTQKVTIESGFGKVYLYAPAHPSSVCFVVQTDAYGSAKVANPYQHLDRAKSFWSLPKSPDFWFKDTPGSVKVKNSSGTTKTALRQITCGDRNFEE